MNSITSFFLITLIATTTSLTIAIQPEGSNKDRPTNQNNQDIGGGDEFFGSGDEFDIPGFGDGWGDDIIGGAGGYGSGYGYGGPKGGHSRHGVTRPTVVCKVKGPCYNKKLRCPAKCFKSFSWSRKGGGGGGGGGGCTMDCKKRCVAYC